MTTTSTPSSNSKLTVSEEDAKIQVTGANNVREADDEAADESDEQLQVRGHCTFTSLRRVLTTGLYRNV